VVRLDGIVVIDTLMDFHPPREIFQWGRSENDAAFGRNFSGLISARDLVRLQIGPVQD
jgi:hypothetical protein